MKHGTRVRIDGLEADGVPDGTRAVVLHTERETDWSGPGRPRDLVWLLVELEGGGRRTVGQQNVRLDVLR